MRFIVIRSEVMQSTMGDIISNLKIGQSVVTAEVFRQCEKLQLTKHFLSDDCVFQFSHAFTLIRF